MKRLIGICLVCALLCTAFVLGAGAAKGDYGYCDTDHNGKVEFTEALATLKAVVNKTDENVSLLDIMYSLQAAIAGESLAATINSIDTNTLTATISTEYFEKITVPLSVFGLDGSAKAADYCGVPAVISIHGPAKTFADRYDGSVNGIYAAEPNLRFTDKPANATATVYSMNELNKEVISGSHANDALNATTLEMSFRDNASLSEETTGSFRFNTAWYPRVRKVNDNLYLLTFMYQKYGQHLYYATSPDGTNWNAPKVLWNANTYPGNVDEDKKIVYSYGPMEGASDKYHAVNPDFCVLDDGTIICVYAIRVVSGYRDYPEYQGLCIKYGTPNDDCTITWSEEKKIYTGQAWEPSIMQLTNGEIHVYFTQVAPDINEFGYDENHRSTETGLIVSNDKFITWTPDIQPDDKNFYRATVVFREYVGDMLDAYTNTYRPHYSGQMPVATELYNGKLFLVTEVRETSGKYHVSYNVSDSVRSWKSIPVGEESKYTKFTSTGRSSPYVSAFPSGEIYLTFNYAGSLYARLGNPNNFTFGTSFLSTPGSAGIWGSCSIVGSHKTATAMHRQIKVTDENGNPVYETNSDGSLKTDENGNNIQQIYNTVNIYYHYLNHRISAKQISVNVDNYTNEWVNNTEAIFVGSESQAQAALQVAHDKDNMYFLVNRLDYVVTSNDKAHVYIAASDGGYYRIDVGTTKDCVVYKVAKNGTETEVYNAKTAVTRVSGTLNINAVSNDKGATTEISVPKSVLGLTSATSIKAAIGITNVDKDSTVSISDTMVDLSDTTNWPTVNLVK